MAVNERGRVVSLGWESRQDENGVEDMWDAESPFGTYYTITWSEEEQLFLLEDEWGTFSRFGSLDEAKRAAHVDALDRCASFVHGK